MECKGKELPQFIEGAKGNFRTPYGLELTNQQKTIINALWRTSTATAKTKAINALCYYLKEQNTAQDFEYYVIYEGSKTGVYHTWGEILKVVGRKNQPQGWKGFFTKEAAEISLQKYLSSQQNPNPFEKGKQVQTNPQYWAAVNPVAAS